MAKHSNSTEQLFLTVRAAAGCLGCSKDELLAWIEPDRRLPGNVGAGSGARLWRPATLDVAKPQIEAWRERDRIADAARAAEFTALQKASTARRKGMRKGGAVTAKAVCEILECSLTELDRWATDGRLSPNGEIVMFGLPKAVNARVWLPGTIETAKLMRDEWRTQDQARKIFKRRGLRQVGQ